jgi:hypothetical protein
MAGKFIVTKDNKVKFRFTVKASNREVIAICARRSHFLKPWLPGFFSLADAPALVACPRFAHI